MLTRTKPRPTKQRDHLSAAALAPGHVKELPTLSAPQVSVIVPTYNRRGLVLAALAALSRQEGPQFEVVIVDDGSKDGSFPAIVKCAAELGLSGRVVRLERNRGPAYARNAGILAARADVFAFTDSDCLPAPGWLQAGLAALRPGISSVQGPTRPPPDSHPPFFSHFMHIERLDGTFSTCNAFYTREAIEEAGGFDPACIYCEDLDLGWRVLARGRVASYASDAIVYHQVIKQTPLEWLRWPGRLSTWPRCVARHPEGRSFLFARYWVSSAHAELTLAIGAIMVAPVFPPALLLVVPYANGFFKRHQLGGRWSFLKAGLHFWWDFWGWLSLARSSIKHRTLVL
jgi:glycosyltransferase involved in cell wall biosynthesis